MREWVGRLAYWSPDPDQALPSPANVGVGEGPGTAKVQPAGPWPETLCARPESVIAALSPQLPCLPGLLFSVLKAHLILVLLLQ